MRAGPRDYLECPCNSVVPSRLATLVSDSRASSSTASPSSPSLSSSPKGKLWWPRGDNKDRVELLQLRGGDKHSVNATSSSPGPWEPAMRSATELEGGREPGLQRARKRVHGTGETARHGPAARIRPAKFKRPERDRRRVPPAGTARGRWPISADLVPRCYSNAWRLRRALS